MDSVERSTVTPSKSRLARTFAKVLHIRALIPDDDIRKTKSKMKKKDLVKKSTNIPSFDDDEVAVKEAFIAKVFASLSAVKAAYAQLQFAESPYDPDRIQSSDQILVTELKNLSELKQCYAKQTLNDTSPETTLLLSEIQEQNSLLTIYEITTKKLDSQLKLKDSEIIFLKEKLADINSDNKLLEKRLKSSGQLDIAENSQLSSLRPTHFMAYFKQAIKSIRSFVHLMVNEMEYANWDLNAAASSIQPGISFWKLNHKCYAFESFVCREMFDGFNHTNISSSSKQEKNRLLFFDRFLELKSVRAADYLAWKPKSTFSTFCRDKYLRLVHPKMEASTFGNLDVRNLVSSGEAPETRFFLAFSEMAKRIWLLHCLALSFDPEVSIFQVSKGSRFCEVYMESLSDEAFLSAEGVDPRVAFMVVPGFRIGAAAAQ
ncbi:hypothetical protein BUALT_Bualt18G0041400 [Buddleja alternifolia]|uniref:DUF641 domain-containing protein n=1 Tax=Buddleja alternifolia TaxID=168488 RepID=A0AAV6W826_9LAMI|nr:hypothetical protein BUALT_Bualt18G0041400 [Buddleja alternifolia]